MELMAKHKYGIRVKNEMVFKNLILKLGKAAATVDLLEVKCSNPISINLDNTTGATRGKYVFNRI